MAYWVWTTRGLICEVIVAPAATTLRVMAHSRTTTSHVDDDRRPATAAGDHIVRGSSSAGSCRFLRLRCVTDCKWNRCECVEKVNASLQASERESARAAAAAAAFTLTNQSKTLVTMNGWMARIHRSRAPTLSADPNSTHVGYTTP